MGRLEWFIGFKIIHDVIKMDIKISQLGLILKTTKGFNNDVDYLIKFITPNTLHSGVLCNKYTVIAL